MVVLVAALAIAQVVLAFAMQNEQRAVAEEMAHGQALSQIVALARLLDDFPAGDADKLAAAFGSRLSCARVAGEPPPTRPMSDVRSGVSPSCWRRCCTTSTPARRRSPSNRRRAAACPCAEGPGARPARRGRGDGEPPHEFGEAISRIVVAVAMTVPLADGRWLDHAHRD